MWVYYVNGIWKEVLHDAGHVIKSSSLCDKSRAQMQDLKVGTHDFKIRN